MEVAMGRSNKTGKKRLMGVMFGILAIGLACTCNGFTEFTTTPTSVPQDFPTLAPQDLSTPVPLENPTPGSQTENILDPAGPWLIIQATDGLWAANQDGSNLVQLIQGEYWQTDLSQAIQPNGNQVVLLSASGDRYHNLALNLLSLPGGEIQKITDLTTSQTEPGSGAGPGDLAIEAVRAIADHPSYAWSPDGSKLAFIGVLDGPTADLYLYEPATNNIIRVSQDDAQNYWPSWSPDGKTILYFGADSFGTGAGYAMRGAWSANGDGSNATLLYVPSSSGEEIIGWNDDQTTVLDSWNPSCGRGLLRKYNLFSGQETYIQEGCFSNAATGKWSGSNSSAVMFSNEDGLFLLPAESSDPQKLSDNQVSAIRWDQTGNMFVVSFSNGSMTTFWGADGRQEDAPAEVQEVAMFGVIWGWTNQLGDLPGVWISGPGIDLGQIFDRPAYGPIWNMDDNTLFFFSASGTGSDLYRATFYSYFNDATPVAHLTGIVQGVGWVGLK
jgi:hypothetical protein